MPLIFNTTRNKKESKHLWYFSQNKKKKNQIKLFFCFKTKTRYDGIDDGWMIEFKIHVYNTYIVQ